MESTLHQIATIEQALELGLRADEFEMIKEILGRIPSYTETAVYSAMWSEPCSLKNSIVWLKTLPKEGPNLIVKSDEKNDGLVNLGEGIGCVLKMESYNHPSATTAVGGINRDIIAMGAQPIAQLHVLRFGNIESDETKLLVQGVTKSFGDFGNTTGIPIVGRDVFFDESYNSQPLVNVFSVGIVDTKKVFSSKAYGLGNPVFIVGSLTAKNGKEEAVNNLHAEQAGDSFLEKLFLEATMELAQTDCIVGIQNIGTAGITRTTNEMSAAGNAGMDIYLDCVPMQLENMLPYEILLSESPNRMLVVVTKGQEEVVKSIFNKHDLQAVEIGVVTDSDRVRYFMEGELVGDVPAKSLVSGGGAPKYDREYKEPTYFKEYKNFNMDSIVQPEDLKEVAIKMLQMPNIASKSWIYEKFDSTKGAELMTVNRTSDAAVVNIKGTNKGVAMTVDCNSRYVHADPEIGAMIAVSEAARNIVCAGGVPSAIANCMNFGNPYNPESYWQFVGAIKGISAASLKFETPVTGGNVSFYNQSDTNGVVVPVFPTPTIGMIGMVEDKDRVMTLDFKEKGDLIFVIGECVNDISSSEYLVTYHGVKASPVPSFDLEKEYAMQHMVKGMIQNELINAAHNVSVGGLYITLVEMCLPRELGFDIVTDSEIREDAFLFGESQGRVVVTVSEDQEADFIEFMMDSGVAFTLLGHVTKGKLMVDDEHFGFIKESKDLYNNALGKLLSK